MVLASCFRCDWSGETDAPACPRCGTALYRPPSGQARGPSETPPVPRDGGAPSPPRTEYLPTSALQGPGPRIAYHSRFLAFAVLAVFLTAGVWWFLRSHEVPEPGDPAASPPPEGHLVYVAGEAGSRRLWSWDPRTGVATQGPALEGEVTHLVGARGALTGWLGVTARGPDGLMEASVLRSQGPDAEAVHLVRADLVAWSSNGASVVSADLGSTASGCSADLRIDRERLDRGVQELVYRPELFCGRISMIGQTLASTYFTWDRSRGADGGRSGVFVLGNGQPHRVLRGWVLVSVSPTSDLLVRPSHAAGAALFWNGAKRPEPYRGIDGSPMQVGEVLTWSIGADAALVVGRLGGRDGLYLLDTTPGGDRIPRYVGLAGEPAAATAAFDGSLYVEIQGRILIWRGDQLVEVDLPEGAPRPVGPLAWLPG